jgi:glyoxylase-like metal-dependent hydrolase (beta-lactamase superfamily II)/rhodanese-related sulfurtransferase
LTGKERLVFEKRFYEEGLAHTSYLIGAGGEAAVVDPRRDVDEYLAVAQAEGMKIVAVLETHPHADFVSGHLKLAKRTGAKIYVSRLAPATYEHVPAKEGDRIRVGPLEIEVIETPGHSPDSLVYLVRDDDRRVTLFTGDTLFVGDVGRPDLRDAEEKPAALAEALYDSLFEKLLALPPESRVLPAHGAGSLCGRNISQAPSSTLGDERRTNWALQLTNRAEFVKRMLASLPDRPQYFAHAVAVNLRGARALDELEKPWLLPEADIAKHAREGAVVLDTRSSASFGKGHFPGSLNVSLDLALFSTWTGFFVPPDRKIALVVEDESDVPRARLELLRIGYDSIVGYIAGRMLTATEPLLQVPATDYRAAGEYGNAALLLDVRTQGEWDAFHLEGALHIPLPALPRRMKELPKSEPLAVICGAGNRSSIAASLLQADGFQCVQNIIGGIAAYREADRTAWHPADLVFPGEEI